jgi:hypothetical protein
VNPFQTAFQQLNTICVSTFGEQTNVNFYPKQSDIFTGNTPIAIQGIVKLPKPEDVLAGGPMGTANVLLFVDYESITPNPQRGDQIVIDTDVYFIDDLKIDEVGGAFLILKNTGDNNA